MDLTVLRQELSSMSEESYAEFVRKLIPNTLDVQGIRLPNLRKTALQIGIDDPITFLDSIIPETFEERMLIGFVIGTLKLSTCPWEKLAAYIQRFIPLIDNWSVCDSFCASLKVSKKETERMYQLIIPYSESKKEYEMRFYIVMCLNYFNHDTYIEDIMSRLNRIQKRITNTDSMYYVLMAEAWEYSMIFIGYPELITERLSELNRVGMSESDKFVFSKTISKIIDSRQISEKDKEKMRQIRSTIHA